MLLGNIIDDNRLTKLTGGIQVRPAFLDLDRNFYASILDDGVSRVIVVPSNWKEMDQSTLEFVMTHELGHHELRHVSADATAPTGSKIEVAKKGLYQEFEADEYAALKVGRKQAMDGLKGVIQWFDKHGFFMDKTKLNGTLVIRMVALMFSSVKWKKAVLAVAFLGAR